MLKIHLLLTKTAPPSLTVPPTYLTCFLGFSILIFHKCNIARVLAVQQILHQVCGLLFRHVLWVAVGALQERRIRMTQQGCRNLFAGTLLQQIGCVEMPQGVQVVFFRQPALFIQLAQMSGKTTSGDRMVYLSKEMCQLLKAWRKECEWVRAQTANETVSEDDYLFRQPNGKPMCPSTFTYRFKLILKANNLPLNLNVHSLRHTNASLLISQGVDVRTVASLLGHAQASTTLDIYAHAFDKNKRKAQEKLGKAIGL